MISGANNGGNPTYSGVKGPSNPSVYKNPYTGQTVNPYNFSYTNPKTGGTTSFGYTSGVTGTNQQRSAVPGGGGKASQVPSAHPAASAPGPTDGSQSGPGILESWFNQRANGTDPGYEYALGRGTRDINNEMAARGGYNSGAAVQRIGDFEANMGAQREGQLDTLAGAASGEHQRRLEDMFTEGLGLAGGQAGTAGAYDYATGNAMSQADIMNLQLQLSKAGVDQKTQQAILQNMFSMMGAGATALGGIGRGGGGGGAGTNPPGMPPSGG